MIKKFGITAGLVLAGMMSVAPVSAQYGGYRSAPPPPPPPGGYRVRCQVPPLPPAPPWAGSYKYGRQHHRTCHAKSWQLHHYERCAGSDGRVSPREQDTIRDLKRDLDRTCGGWRWRG